MVVRHTRQALAEPFVRLADACVSSLNAGGRILFFGNGGSAADAQHLAAELAVRYVGDRPAIAGLALTTDSSVLTAAANDLGFERIFSRPDRGAGTTGRCRYRALDLGQERQCAQRPRAGAEPGTRRGGFRRPRRRGPAAACRSPSVGSQRRHRGVSRKCTSPLARCCAAPSRPNSDSPGSRGRDPRDRRHRFRRLEHRRRTRGARRCAGRLRPPPRRSAGRQYRQCACRGNDRSRIPHIMARRQTRARGHRSHGGDLCHHGDGCRSRHENQCPSLARALGLVRLQPRTVHLCLLGTGLRRRLVGFRRRPDRGLHGRPQRHHALWCQQTSVRPAGGP